VGAVIDKIAKRGTATTAAAVPRPEGEETLKTSTRKRNSAWLQRMCGRTRKRVTCRDYTSKAVRPCLKESMEGGIWRFRLRENHGKTQLGQTLGKENREGKLLGGETVAFSH